ncbi:putative sgs1 protein [Rhizophagus clarus]|uniref:DNA 3'-5' helicase n=1 Tax=Rhizophagus clarus TaxID=94130 RepID=A0A8H3LTH5_9GLOM|nr:putative sgs1 protein [Rhizophagus clarus]
MKTGGEKTLCYALSAVCSKGLTIVFSPLKALIENQKVTIKNLNSISIGYFHGGLHNDERKIAMNNWKSNNMQIMVTTSVFGMDINSNNIHVVIHAEAPMTNLIQEAKHAGHNRNIATHVIFFSKKNIQTNYSILVEYCET